MKKSQPRHHINQAKTGRILERLGHLRDKRTESILHSRFPVDRVGEQARLLHDFIRRTNECDGIDVRVFMADIV